MPAPLIGARIETEMIEAARARVPALRHASAPAVLRYALSSLLGVEPVIYGQGYRGRARS